VNVEVTDGRTTKASAPAKAPVQANALAEAPVHTTQSVNVETADGASAKTKGEVTREANPLGARSTANTKATTNSNRQCGEIRRRG